MKVDMIFEIDPNGTVGSKTIDKYGEYVCSQCHVKNVARAVSQRPPSD